MANSPLVSLITPTYNERDNLALLVRRVHSALNSYPYELIIVDDNSPDGTAEIAQELSQRYPIQVICRQERRGLASAIMEGFKQAQGEILGVIGANLKHPPEKIPELLGEVENGIDLVIASRYVSAEGLVGRRIPRLIARLARLLLPSIGKIKDPLSDFFLIKRKWLENLELRPASYKLLLNILTDGKVKEIKEIPYNCQEAALGSSKFNFKGQAKCLEQILFFSGKDGEVKRFIKFCLVGASGIGISTAVFWLLFLFTGVHDLVALPLSIEASIISGFILNNFWTFQDKKAGKLKDTVKRGLKFNLISLVSLLIYYAIYTPLTRLYGFYEPLAFLIAVGAGVVWNFSLSMLWTWRTKVEEREPAYSMPQRWSRLSDK
jgi:dolichol-phosphate mannosyltransferase